MLIHVTVRLRSDNAGVPSAVQRACTVTSYPQAKSARPLSVHWTAPEAIVCMVHSIPKKLSLQQSKFICLIFSSYCQYILPREEVLLNLFLTQTLKVIRPKIMKRHQYVECYFEVTAFILYQFFSLT